MVELTTIFYVLIMAVVQGVAEFLPISSSGHLLLLGKFFELPETLTLSILLHAGTLMSVIVYFSDEIIEACFHRPRVIFLVIVGSIPTAIIAFIILKFFPELEENLLLTGFLFIGTGILLMTILRSRCQLSERQIYYEKIAALEAEDEGYEPELRKTAETTTWFDAILIGISQGVAALPGLSRSGSTISTAVGLNCEREWAAKFSFLLSIPVIGGGALLELVKLFKAATGETFSEKILSDPFFAVYLGGAVVSFLVGWLSLACLMKMLREGRLHFFAYWLFIIGPCTIGYWCWLNWEKVVPYLGGQEAVDSFLKSVGIL